MGQIISEGLEYIGRIDDDGYVYDQAGKRFAWINDSGYIVGNNGSDILGKIDEDGTIRNASLSVIGRIQADGYVYIHSNRICKISSAFIERITPKAWNAGEYSSFQGRETERDNNYSEHGESFAFRFFTSKFFIKLVIGIILGIIAMTSGWGGIGMLLAGPVFVFLFSLIWKIFN